jgi:hypothetical protein
MEFSAKDREQLQGHGLSVETVLGQLDRMCEARHALRVLRPAVPGDGIEVLSEQERNRLETSYDTLMQDRRCLKFVPASGAATRMFKKWFQMMGDCTPEAASELAETLPRYPFYPQLAEALRAKGTSLDKLDGPADYADLLRFILTEEGWGFGRMPKGLLPFHLYGDKVRTAFEEHWVEGASYAVGGDGRIRLHFTVSPEHEEAFRKLAVQLKTVYEKVTGYMFEVDFSQQMPETDTVSLDSDGNLFRDSEGRIVFRPGGHGSLLLNLNRLDADVVFVKNIDNVTTDALRGDTIQYKKCLAALLLERQQACFEALRQLDAGADEARLSAIERMMRKDLQMAFPTGYGSFGLSQRVDYCRRQLDRPIRVCGMVKREKDPGGGPFWVEKDGVPSLQIVETSEMDLEDAAQRQCLDDSQYFNPVDLVCSWNGYKGGRFDLRRHVDNSRYFTTEKSSAGKTLRVLEHPGLWNGSMSDWITLFVAVPLSTFTPVKTVEDLLRPAHVFTSNTR